MREIRTSGSEGGAAQTNAPFLPLSVGDESGDGDGFDLGEGELASADLEEELGADLRHGGGDDGDDALERGILAGEADDDGFTEDDAEAVFDVLFPLVEFLLPFAVAVPGGGLVEIELSLIEVHGDGGWESGGAMASREFE
jgi:hypothetical protein